MTASRTRAQLDVEMLALDARQITRRLATHNDQHREQATRELRRIVETYAERRSADAVLARRLLALVEQATDTPPWLHDLEVEMRTLVDRADALIALAVTDLATVKEQAARRSRTAPRRARRDPPRPSGPSPRSRRPPTGSGSLAPTTTRPSRCSVG